MARFKTPALVFGATLLLSACSTVSDVGDFLWPSLSGDEPAAPEIVEAPSSVAQPEAYPPQAQYPGPSPYPSPYGAQPYAGAPVQAGPTGTFVGAKIAQLRTDLASMQAAVQAHTGDLARIRANIAGTTQAFQANIGAIRARLQAGTTPGNPILVRQWNDAQVLLDQMNAHIAQLNSLSNRAAADAGLASFLLESTRSAYELAGAMEEDHRQLGLLEDDVNKTVVSADRVLNETADEIRRQNDYLGRERENLQMLSVAVKNGELYGDTLASAAYGARGGAVSEGPGQPARRPLVVVRFDRDNVDYQQALYTAVSRAMERRPGAAFDVVAVSPAGGARGTSTARRYAERVARSLAEMGLPADRVNLTASTSTDTTTNEVHVYVR